MATALPALSPLWRNSLRTWLAATLTIGIMLWSGRSSVMLLGMLMAVLFINDNELTPLRFVSQMVGGAVIGILTAVVLHQISSGWLITALGLLITGALVRGLGLLKGLSMGYMGCWALEVMGYGKHFTWALIFDLAFTVVVGIAMAQLATWAFWPKRPLQQLPLLERQLSEELSRQVGWMRQWLSDGGTPPPLLRSQELLPQILLLQQLRDQRRESHTPAGVRRLSSRWAQMGSIWRQLLRQWMLLEPLLLQLAAPLQTGGLLQERLASLEHSLQTPAPAGQTVRLTSVEAWLAEARQGKSSAPLLLAIAQQLDQLEQLLSSRALLRQAIEHTR
jgi:uncharacterized membrane protein YgaE (UPF0421/DUF939 family)